MDIEVPIGLQSDNRETVTGTFSPFSWYFIMFCAWMFILQSQLFCNVWVPSVEYLSDHVRQLTVCQRLLLIFFCQSM